MNVHLQSNAIHPYSEIQICGSKSESNRLLILQAIYPEIKIENLSTSEDTRLLQNALILNEKSIDIHHAGTAMRFLTAYFATQKNREVVLTGSDRMKQRPIGELVNALSQLGAQIEYLEKEGFPPLKITGTEIFQNKVSIHAAISSQFITALLLIAPSLKNGMEIELVGKITSQPYIQMTLDLLNQIGVKTTFKDNKITIDYLDKTTSLSTTVHVESDWSSASYFYSFVALSPLKTKTSLSIYKKNSLQGDAALVAIYKNFGVQTTFQKNNILIKKTTNPKTETLNLALHNTPDLAQTIVVTCFGLGIACHLTGLHTLKIKETDRLEALKKELEKLGAVISISEESLTLASSSFLMQEYSEKAVFIKTYNDHRMAMAFAPLVLKKTLTIEDANVVDKSYPKFWLDLQKAGVQIIIK
ncbi:MAG: 3-phosphoshikimate 1-carboxyvinyltransferase [Bacteroidetes bacterium HGW-Bacteroidetes-2]|jgi:3-phosphoshikimate 1-carboxyvinyltransferase|nr:MAG: 3-phosphoshikimate 1-carboxyvinyltransferase [Bacteroidetes bacterium HGW-Bacteroidetes-2]